MPRYNVEHKGKWTCFSSISDGFITPFMEKEEYEQWRKEEYGTDDYQPAEMCNGKSMLKAVFFIQLNRTREQALNCLVESGLSKEECEQLLYDVESAYYVPNEKENGDYECPNCWEKVEKGQLVCKKRDCERTFVWRE